MTNKEILIVCRSTPYGSSNAKEALDLVLAAATFDQSVTLLFSGDGCYQLIGKHQSERIHSKSMERMMSALPVYGVDNIYIDALSLKKRAINPELINASAQAIDTDTIKSLYESATTVLHF